MVEIRKFVLKAEPLDAIEAGQFGASSFFREMFEISKMDTIPIAPLRVQNQNPLDEVHVVVDYKIVKKDYNTMQFDDSGEALMLKEDEIAQEIQAFFKGKYINTKERFAVKVCGGNCVLICYVEKVIPIDVKSRQPFGILNASADAETDIVCKPKNPKKLKVESNRMTDKQVFKKNMNFQELGIGGLDKEFNEIFRRAFNSRRYPQSIIEKYGIKHVKGMLLYGPPGTGKTLIARKISEALNCEKPQVVNGPEIFDKFVGGSEEKIRKLFEPAEKDMKEKGDQSDLHVIIFDEIDAICRKRGSTGSSGTGVNESVVNQLLSKMDGVDSLNNILIIGMTNRKDMIDEAILRPGRLEIHLEIGLPDLKGRLQIFEIHTRNMKKNGLLGDDVDLNHLSNITKNYTGAEIEAVCRSATSFALFKDVSMQPKEASSVASGIKVDEKKKKKKEGFVEHKILQADFMRALDEIKPAFGMDNDCLENKLVGGFFSYGPAFQHLYGKCTDFINEIRTSNSTQLLSILLEGKQRSGKTAIAAKLAIESDFPFVKMISPENFVGVSEYGKISEIVKTFDDAYKSNLSLIILDDIERLFEFIHIGPRFSNPILQALLVLIKKTPPRQDRKLMIIGTTSMKSTLEEMDVVDSFNVCLNVPQVSSEEEIGTVLDNYPCGGEEMKATMAKEAASAYMLDGVSIKNLILAIEIAMQKDPQQQVQEHHLLDSLRAIQN